MKFGFFVQDIFDESRRPRYAPMYEVCQRAEEAGFDFVAMGHHRFSPDCTLASPITTLAAIAAQTNTLRLSSATSCC